MRSGWNAAIYFYLCDLFIYRDLVWYHNPFKTCCSRSKDANSFIRIVKFSDLNEDINSCVSIGPLCPNCHCNRISLPVGLQGDLVTWGPSVVFGSMSCVAVAVVLLLPETKDRALAEVISAGHAPEESSEAGARQGVQSKEGEHFRSSNTAMVNEGFEEKP